MNPRNKLMLNWFRVSPVIATSVSLQFYFFLKIKQINKNVNGIAQKLESIPLIVVLKLNFSTNNTIPIVWNTNVGILDKGNNIKFLKVGLTLKLYFEFKKNDDVILAKLESTDAYT